MEKSLKYENYPLVHIASHFKFSGGDETHSVLLLGDGSHLPLSELRLIGNVFDKVDLLVLAACQTAKIEALRQAQLQMAGLPDLLGKKSPAIPNNSRDSRANFHDAYRWGPFIMIGNWR